MRRGLGEVAAYLPHFDASRTPIPSTERTFVRGWLLISLFVGYDGCYPRNSSREEKVWHSRSNGVIIKALVMAQMLLIFNNH
ncbi:MAG: hypothetical protein HC862_01150 [Scytonema sp. RU_4_4]|nr:hypothetical protein [Scytonema sp. RU_4_4]NJR74397.1 hypothetical protein [Scytonema sp. CRU_2_7]